MSSFLDVFSPIVWVGSLLAMSGMASRVSWTCNKDASRGVRVGRAAGAALGNAFYLVWAAIQKCMVGERRVWVLIMTLYLVMLAGISGVATTLPEVTIPIREEIKLNATQKNTVMLVGDSNTYFGFDASISGWGVLLSKQYPQVAWENQGWPGYTTKTIRLMFERTMLPKLNADTKLVILCLGTNDANNYGMNYITTYRKNLKRFIYQIRMTSPKTAILLMTPPIIGAPNTRYEGSYETMKAYAAAALEVAKNERVASLDLFHAMTFDDIGPDEIHFVAPGNKTIFQAVNTKLASMNLPFLQ